MSFCLHRSALLHVLFCTSIRMQPVWDSTSATLKSYLTGETGNSFTIVDPRSQITNVKLTNDVSLTLATSSASSTTSKASLTDVVDYSKPQLADSDEDDFEQILKLGTNFSNEDAQFESTGSLCRDEVMANSISFNSAVDSKDAPGRVRHLAKKAYAKCADIAATNVKFPGFMVRRPRLNVLCPLGKITFFRRTLIDVVLHAAIIFDAIDPQLDLQFASTNRHLRLHFYNITVSKDGTLVTTCDTIVFKPSQDDWFHFKFYVRPSENCLTEIDKIEVKTAEDDFKFLCSHGQTLPNKLVKWHVVHNIKKVMHICFKRRFRNFGKLLCEKLPRISL